jgi:hypothetical protein
MACLQVKCSNPKCKRLNNVRAKVCKCGVSLAKHSGKTYYINTLTRRVRRNVKPLALTSKRLNTGL